jgi:hypothetical protein
MVIFTLYCDNMPVVHDGRCRGRWAGHRGGGRDIGAKAFPKTSHKNSPGYVGACKSRVYLTFYLPQFAARVPEVVQHELPVWQVTCPRKRQTECMVKAYKHKRPAGTSTQKLKVARQCFAQCQANHDMAVATKSVGVCVCRWCKKWWPQRRGKVSSPFIASDLAHNAFQSGGPAGIRCSRACLSDRDQGTIPEPQRAQLPNREQAEPNKPSQSRLP